MTPFAQLPFVSLPALPRVPHRFYELPERRVSVWTPALGEVECSVRVLGSGPPLVLVHGLMTSGYSFRYVIEALAEHHTVYVPDLPGSGRSTKPDRPLTWEAMADWLQAFCESLGLRQPDVIGNSMGGYLAMWWALRTPRAMRKLVVLHAPGIPNLRLRALWWAIRLPGARSVLRWLVQRAPRRWAHRNVHYYDESLKSLEEAAEYGDVLATDEGLTGFYRQLRDTMDVRGCHALLRLLDGRHEAHCDFPVPVQLVYARQDPMVAPSIGRALTDRIPGAELHWVKRGSHFMHVDAPEEFLEIVDAWFARR